MDDVKAQIAQILLGQQNPSVGDMRNYIDRTPSLAGANQGQSIVPPYILDGHQILPEAAAAADPFGVSQIQRWMGSELPAMVRINEGHGLMSREIDRMRGRK